MVGFADPDSATFGFRGGDPTGVRDFTERFPTASGRRRAAHHAADVSHRSDAGAGRGDAPGRGSPARSGRPPRHHRRRGGRRRGRRARPRRPVAPARRDLHAALGDERVGVRGAAAARGAPAPTACRGRGWRSSCGRCSTTTPALRRALTQAGVPVTTGADDTALATQPAVAPLLHAAPVRARRVPIGRRDGGRRCCTRRWAAPTRSRSAGCGRRCARRPRAVGDRRPSGELLVEALLDAGRAGPGRAALGPPGARHRRADRHRPRGRGPARPRPPRTCCGRCGAASGLADRWAAAQRPWRAARRHRRPGPRRGARALRRGGPVHRPAAGRADRGVPATTCSTSSCRPTRWRRSAERGEAVRILTAHAAKGLEWDVVAVVGVQEGVWPDLRLRGSVLGSERLVDVAAGRDVDRRPGYVDLTGVRAARRGAAALLRRHDPGPARACWSPRSTRARPAAAARSSPAGSSPSWRWRRERRARR